MTDLTGIRQRIIIILIVLGVVDVAAATYLLLPSRNDLTAQRQALNAAEMETQRLTRVVAPLRGVDGKLKQADTDIQKFYKNRLASRYSDVVEEVGKLASRENVSISGVQYKTESTDIPELLSLKMQADFHGPYSSLAKFINALERDKIFFIIDTVSLAGGSSQSGPGQRSGNEVRLNIKFETYLQNES